MSRLYIGRLPRDARERDLERLFKGYGDIEEVVLLSGFAFVEFRDRRDAEDVIAEFNGRDFMGERIIVEPARSDRRGGGGGFDRHQFGDIGGRGGGFGRPNAGPQRTRYRVLVENLSTSVSWQDLKDFMRRAGDVSFADAHKIRECEGVVEYTSEEGMLSAVRKLDGEELRGRRLVVRLDRPRGPPSPSYRRSRSPPRRRRSPSYSRRSRSPRGGSRRSRSPRRSRSRSRGAYRSRSRGGRRSRSYSRSPVRSRSRSPVRTRTRSPTRSRSPVAARSPAGSRSRSPAGSRSRSPRRSHSPDRSRSRRRSVSPPRDGVSPSRTHSPDAADAPAADHPEFGSDQPMAADDDSVPVDQIPAPAAGMVDADRPASPIA